MSDSYEPIAPLPYIHLADRAKAILAEFKTRGMTLDEGIQHAVVILLAGGVETYESCEGGPDHAFPEPTIRFHGGRADGLRALAWAQTHGLHVSELRRFWSINDGEPTGPHWEMTFVPPGGWRHRKGKTRRG